MCIQKIVRGFLARKQHRPRYRGIIKIKSLKEKLHPSTHIINQPNGSKDMILEQSNEIKHLISCCVGDIQDDNRISAQTIDKMYTDIMAKIDNHNNMIQTAETPLPLELPQNSRAASPVFEVNGSDALTVASTRILHRCCATCESTTDSTVKKCKFEVVVFDLNSILYEGNNNCFVQTLIGLDADTIVDIVTKTVKAILESQMRNSQQITTTESSPASQSRGLGSPDRETHPQLSLPSSPSSLSSSSSQSSSSSSSWQPSSSSQSSSSSLHITSAANATGNITLQKL